MIIISLHRVEGLLFESTGTKERLVKEELLIVPLDTNTRMSRFHLYVSRVESVVLFAVSPMFVVERWTQHIHFVCVLLFVEERIFVVFKVCLFLDYKKFTSFAFLKICSSDLNIGYKLGRNLMHSAMWVPEHSSFILLSTFLFDSS